MFFVQDSLHLYLISYVRCVLFSLMKMAVMFVFNFKKYFRFSVGGMTDVAEIKGHRFVWNTFFTF